MKSSKLVAKLIRWQQQISGSKQKIRGFLLPGTSALMKLPPEIRYQIYNAVLDLPATDHIALLCACKQIYLECHHFLFKRPLSCKSQVELYWFTERYSHELLRNITCLTLRLEEVDVVSMQPLLSRLAGGLPTKYCYHPHIQEAQRIVSSLRRLPNIQELKILPSQDMTKNSAPEPVVKYVLNWVAQHYPTLESLSIAVENISLGCLSSMASLRSLQFPGYSQTKPEETARILRQAKTIRELVIVGPPQIYRWQQRTGLYHHTRQSITTDVILQMNPLEKFTLCEMSDASSAPVFFTTSLFIALFETHGESLCTLHLASNKKPDSAVYSLVARLLPSTPKLSDLTIGWPELPLDIVSRVPASTRKLSLAVLNSTHAEAILTRLKQIRHQLPHLRQIRLDLIDESDVATLPQSLSNPMVAASTTTSS